MNPLEVEERVTAELAKIKSEKGIHVFVLKPEDYYAVNKVISSYLTKNLKSLGVYVSLNNSCRSILEMFDKEKIDTKRLLFIECAGQEQKSKIDNCISLKSNQSLTELSLSISKVCQNEKVKFIIFNSVSTLLIYNSRETTERFIYYIVNKIRNLNLFMILISIEEERSNKLLPILSQLCDSVIKI